MAECDILDMSGVPIKHWCYPYKKGKIYIPVPLRYSVESLFDSFDTYLPRDDDIWICGYPKSGNHWTYENIQILLNDEAKPHNRVMARYFVEAQESLSIFDSSTSPRVFVTHMPYFRLPKAVKERCKIIALIRNPKSAVVSYYNHMKNAVHNQYQGKFEDFWPLYVKGFVDELIFKDWFTNTRSYWEASKECDNILTLFYEEMVQHQMKEIKKVCKFLQLDRNDSFLEEVIKLTKLEHLKDSWYCKHEDDLKYTAKMSSSLIYRKGIIDDWKNYFTVEDNKTFDILYKEKMAAVPDLADRIKFE